MPRACKLIFRVLTMSCKTGLFLTVLMNLMRIASWLALDLNVALIRQSFSMRLISSHYSLVIGNLRLMN